MPRLAHRFNLLPLLFLLAACGGAPPEDVAPVAGPRVENPQIGLAVNSVPVGFSVEINDGDTLRFKREDASGGTLSVASGPSEMAGINLVEATTTHKAEILAQAQGVYSGTLELSGPFGTAYQSRGRYANSDGSGVSEDFRIYTVHPTGDRLVTLRYLYPVGSDTKEERQQRQQHLFAFLGELEMVTAETP